MRRFVTRKSKAYFQLVPVWIGLIVFGQQCSRTPLEVVDEFNYSSSLDPNLIKNPVDMVSYQRLVIAIDMSWSMISGPCPQDLSEVEVYNNSALKAREAYDPNFAGGKYYAEMPNGIYFDDADTTSTADENNVRSDGFPGTLSFAGKSWAVSGPFSNNEYDNIASGTDCVIDSTIAQNYAAFSTAAPQRFPAGITAGTNYVLPGFAVPSRIGGMWASAPFNAAPYASSAGATSIASFNFPFFDYDLGYNSVSKTKSPAVRNVYRAYSGLDALGKRFDLATKILEDMKGGSPNTQVMIVPISGGVAQSKLFGVVAPQFVSIDVAIGRVQALKEEQLRNATEGQRAGDEWRYEKRTMGTTAPNDVLRGYHDPDKNMYYYNEYDDLGDSGWMRRPSIYQMIENEMIILRRQKKLPRATFSVLMLTDGRVTPSPKDIENARELLGCPSATSCPYNSVFSQFWGDADLNTKEELKSTVEDFLSLPARKFENEGMVKFDIIDLNAYAQDTKLFPPEWEADPEKSPFFQELTLPGFAVWRLLGDSKEETNYRAGSVPKDPTVLEVRQVYVLNLNVRAKGDGSKCVDSDADGLCDSEESAAGTSPTELRTNGFCMDSIYTRFTDSCDAMAAQRLCDPNMDFDGDSLNSCEESLIGTSNFDFDSDDDEIPDYLAWLYGFSPTSSLRNTDSNGDGISDLMNFKAGLGPNMDYKSIPEAVKSTYTSNEIPYRVDNGRWATIREIHISHLPTAFLLPLSGGEVSGYGFTDESGNPIPSNLILPTYSTSGDLNKFIVLAKVIDSTNPRNVWWYLHNGSFNLHTRTLPDLIRLSNLNQIVMALDPQDLK